MTKKRIVLDEGWAALDLTAENADLPAQYLGFRDVDELKPLLICAKIATSGSSKQQRF